MQAKIKARRKRFFRFLLKERQGTSLPTLEDPSRDEEKAVNPEIPRLTPNNYTSVQDDSATVVTSLNDAPKPLSRSSQVLSPQMEQMEDNSAVTQQPLPPPPSSPTAPVQNSYSHYPRLLYTYSRAFIKGLFNPVSIAIYIALPISLIPQLKALFIEVPGVHMPPAPDGQPPLAFIQDIATFIGAASIPLGLVCLGSSLARLNVPVAQWRKLPVGAISWLAIGKMIIIPVLGVLICQGLVNAGVLFKDDKVLIFVCM